MTFDEGARTIYPDAKVSDIARRVGGADNHIVTIVATACGAPMEEPARLDHFSLLATLEEGFGLPRLRKAKGAADMSSMFFRGCAGPTP